jgi:DNA-binding transcriptional regulator YiaG
MEYNKPTPVSGETIADYRARIAQHQAEILDRRQQELLEQTSTLHTPAMRIRIWERLHQVAMPRSPAHRLLDVIAANTGLSVEEVREEQRQRIAPPIGPES